MRFEVSERVGELSFGIMWISLDGRLNSNWYQTFKEAKKHYLHLINLRAKPSLVIRIEDVSFLKEKK